MKSLRYKIRYLAFVWAYFECLGYGGLIYGWGSLVYVLKDEGIYLDLCKEDSSDLPNNTTSNVTAPTKEKYDPDCDARDGIFNLTFTIASLIFGVGIFLLGMISMKFGTRITRLTATVTFIVGSLCIAATSTDVPWLIFPGLSLIGVAGVGIFVTNIQVSFLFPVWGSAVLSLLSGAFDASAVVQLLVKIGYENGISRSTSYFILTAVFLLTLVNTFLLLPKHFIEKREVGEIAMTPVSVEISEGVKKETEKAYASKGEQSMKLTPRNVAKAVISPEFFIHVYWGCVLHLRHVNYQATINSVLEKTLDTDDEVSRYTNVYLYALLLGVVVSFLPGIVFDYNVKIFQNSETAIRRRLMPAVFPLLLTSMIVIVLSIFSLFTSPETLYVEFVVVVFLRAFFYSTLATYVRQLFPSEFFTTLYGILFMGAGLFSLLNYALFTWAENENSQQMYIFQLILCITTLVHPLYQWRQCW